MSKPTAARPAPADPELIIAPLARTGPLVDDADGPTGVAVAEPWGTVVGTVPLPVGMG